MTGPDPGRCNRCICIGQKKIADAFIGQIFTAYPRTITLTFPPLIYIAMFQNLLFNNVNIKIFILDFVYVFESACIKCVYAIAHMSDYM